MDVVPLSITQDQYERIKVSKAVVVGKYQGEGGMFSRLEFIGELTECEEVVETPSLFIIPNGVEYLGHDVILTSDLIPPEGSLP
jgi:hypothetical protein